MSLGENYKKVGTYHTGLTLPKNIINNCAGNIIEKTFNDNNQIFAEAAEVSLTARSLVRQNTFTKDSLEVRKEINADHEW